MQAQRSATVRHLQQLTRLKVQAGDRDDLAWQLVLEKLLFTAEAEVRWLDHIEVRVARAARTRTRQPAPARSDAVDASPDVTR